MKRTTLPITAVKAILAAFILNSAAATGSNPYEMIVARNPFALRPILEAEPQRSAVAPSALLPEIKITGITTLLTEPKALFQYEDKEAKKTEFPPLLSEGDTYKMLSVLQIDAENNRVRIRNGNTEMMLDFIANGVKPSVSAVAASSSKIASTAGAAPTQTLPPAFWERMRQMQERKQAEQAASSGITSAPGPAGSFSSFPSLPTP